MNRRTRRRFLKDAGTLTAAAAVAPLLASRLVPDAQAAGPRPNVLFLMVDDLNDFPGAFGGYSGSLTPNIDKLARQGVAFQRAFCAAPYCGASRASIMTGAAPYRTGVTGNQNIMDAAERAKASAKLGQPDLLTIPAFFRSQGYRVSGGGKLFHGGFGRPATTGFDENAWHEYLQTDWNEIANVFRGVRNYRDNRTYDQLMGTTQASEGALGDLPNMIGADYNTIDQENMMPDKRLAAWAVNQFLTGAASPAQPWFMGVGIYRPHIAMFVPQRFYDMYPLDSIRVPDYYEQLDDLRDLPDFALRYLVNMDWTAYGSRLPDGSKSSDEYLLQAMLPKNNRNGHAQAIQAYLASVTFADECVGQVLSALDHSGQRGNTIVVLCSDHGWALGEKLTWQKYKLWEKATRVPFIISKPGVGGVNNYTPVSLLDLFPTLVEMTGGALPTWAAGQLSGVSLAPLLANQASASTEWGTAVITTQAVDPSSNGDATNGPNALVFHSVRTNQWRYVRYPQTAGAAFREELYDLSVDPAEKRNLLYWEPDKYRPIADALLGMLTKKIGPLV